MQVNKPSMPSIAMIIALPILAIAALVAYQFGSQSSPSARALDEQLQYLRAHDLLRSYTVSVEILKNEPPAAWRKPDVRDGLQEYIDAAYALKKLPSDTALLASTSEARAKLIAIADQLSRTTSDNEPVVASWLLREFLEARSSVYMIAELLADLHDQHTDSLRTQLKTSWQYIAGIALLSVLLAAVFILVAFARNSELAAQKEMLEESEEKLKQLSFYRQQFLANMSHEFRTPLNAIQGFSEALLYMRDTVKIEQALEYVELISKSAKDLGKLTEDVLDMAKIDAGAIVLNIEDVDLESLIADSTLQFGTILARKDMSIEANVQKSWLVSCDKLALKRCITNLISNAIKFSDTGGTIYVDAYLRDGSVLVIEISDRGCGIPERELQSIWAVYARSSLTKRSDREGTGLGLALVKGLMDAHGGFVELLSREGSGTSVRLCLQASRIVAVRPTVSADRPQAQRVKRQSAQSG